jgi:signal transduction histidine kinase/ActR/RegA family two-component response regulator
VPYALLLAMAATSASATPAAFKAKAAATEDALMANPRQALLLAAEAARIADTLPDKREAAIASATAGWLKAEALIGLNRAAEANAPAEAASRLIAQVAPASKLAGDIERTLGALAAGKGDVRQALRRYQLAYKRFNASGERRSSAMALLDIGQVYWDAGDYPRMLQYFGQAEELMPAGDANLQLVLFNARGEVFRAMRRFPEAEVQYARALRAAQTLNSAMLQVRILTNLAIAQAMAGKLDAAEASVRRGTRLSRGPDVAEWRPYLLGAAARIAKDRKDYATAARLLESAFAGQNLAGTQMSWREMHELAAAVFEVQGRREEALAHLRAFQRLDKEAQALIATNSAQLMAAQFDFTNQNLRISQLKQGQLERDVQIARQRARLSNGLLIAISIIVAVLGAAYISIRRSRDRVRAANDELADANGQLAETNDQLEDALKAKSEFLATTSHEIRTPLNGILGMTQVLLADRRIDGETREKIEVVHGAGETMQALVDDLLDVAKLEHGGLTIAIDQTDVRRLVEDAARLWGAQAESKGLVLGVENGDLPFAIMTDGGRVRQILFNLLSNAVKFTLDGRVDLRCRLDDTGDAATLVLAVTDTGIGIAAEHHDRIFEAFAQVDGGTTRQFSGTGLGLSIVASLTRALGGTLSLVSAPGEGSTFTVRIPVSLAGSELPVLDDARMFGLADASVLVVDADPTTQVLLRVLLMGQGAEVDATADIRLAAETVAAGGIDLVVADISALPGDGETRLALLRALAHAARTTNTRLAIMQGADALPPIAELFTLGADQIIAKPIDAPDLMDALDALWRDDPPSFVAPALLRRSAA